MRKKIDLVHECGVCKTRVHQLTNTLQLVISYLEIGEYAKALQACKDAIGNLREVAIGITTLSKLKPGNSVTHSLPEGSQLTVPPDTLIDRTGAKDQLTVDTPKGKEK